MELFARVQKLEPQNCKMSDSSQASYPRPDHNPYRIGNQGFG